MSPSGAASRLLQMSGAADKASGPSSETCKEAWQIGCNACTMLRLIWEQAILVNCDARH